MTYCYFCKGNLAEANTQSFERYHGSNKTKYYHCHTCKVSNNLEKHPITIFEIWKDYDRLYKIVMEAQIKNQDFLIEINFNAPHETWIYPIVATMLGNVTKGAILKLKAAPLTPSNIMTKLPIYLTFL